MPKLTKEQLAAVKYVSIKDFCTRIDQLEDMKDKLDFATRYILSHGMGNEQPDAPIEKIIKVAQMKLADQSADIKTGFRETDVNKGKGFKMVDPNVIFYGNDVANQMFIVNPVGYLKGEARRLGDDIGGSWMSNEEIATKAHYGHLRNDVFTDELASKISDELQKPTSFDVQVRLENKLGGPAALKKAVDATKPGVLSGFFGTRSVAAANLDAAYKAFNNPNHVLYGNLPSVEKASTQYLQHVFPNWKPDREEGVPGNLPTEADINRLSGTRKARALFSLNLLNAAKAREDGGQLQGNVRLLQGRENLLCQCSRLYRPRQDHLRRGTERVPTSSQRGLLRKGLPKRTPRTRRQRGRVGKRSHSGTERFQLSTSPTNLGAYPAPFSFPRGDTPKPVVEYSPLYDRA